MLDLIQNGSSWEEIVTLAKAVEKAGATIINTGIGWHEARIPTIATLVPRAAFTWVTAKMKKEVSIPLVTSNRINMPDVAERCVFLCGRSAPDTGSNCLLWVHVPRVLARGDADMVSMARPFLADPNFVRKVSLKTNSTTITQTTETTTPPATTTNSVNQRVNDRTVSVDTANPTISGYGRTRGRDQHLHCMQSSLFGPLVQGQTGIMPCESKSGL